MIAILGAGAMGSAPAVHWARHRTDVALLATEHDAAAGAAWRGHQPHTTVALALAACRCTSRRPRLSTSPSTGTSSATRASWCCGNCSPRR